jgi:chemotaxis protein MotA
MIIGGAALGAFLQANPGYMTMHDQEVAEHVRLAFSPRLLPEVLGLITRSSTRAAAKA